MLSVAPRAAGAGLGTGASTNNPKKREKEVKIKKSDHKVQGPERCSESDRRAHDVHVQIAVAHLHSSALSAERS